MAKPEVWMRGAVPGVDPWLQPVVHSLLQSREELDAVLSSCTDAQLWLRPGGAASIAYHVDHIGGSLDRLLTYARGESLTPAQFAALKEEGQGTTRTTADLLTGVQGAIDRAVAQVQATAHEALLEPRRVGRAGHPSTVLGLLFHAAEHALRHAGQAVTTARVVAIL